MLALLIGLGGRSALPAEPPATAPVEAPSLKIYPLDPGNAAVVEMVRQLAGTNGLVTLDRANGRILVSTTTARHAQIAEAVPGLRTPPRNVRIEVRFNQGGRERRTGLSLETQRGGYLEQDGLVKGRFHVRPAVTETVSQTTTTTRQFLLVASGREAALFVGAEVPYLDYILDYGVHCGALAERIAWQKVGAYLLVQPTVLGDGPDIEIRLTPSLSGLVEGRPMETRFTTLATTLTVRDGATVNLGGLGQSATRKTSGVGGRGAAGPHATFYAKFLMGTDRSGAEQALDITLTPHIVGPAGS